jgi:hypothetical protein
VTGIDVDASAVAHTRSSHSALPDVRFDERNAASLPLPDAWVMIAGGAVALGASSGSIRRHERRSVIARRPRQPFRTACAISS